MRESVICKEFVSRNYTGTWHESQEKKRNREEMKERERERKGKEDGRVKLSQHRRAT